MKKVFYPLALAAGLSAAMLSGCGKRLDVAPVNSVPAETALNNSNDVETLLKGGYELAGDQYLYGGGFQYYSDFLGDNGEIQFGGTYSQPKEIFNKRILVNNSFVSFTWINAYRTINVANTVLANLGKVTATKADAVAGGAKFLRGSLYFDLVRLYARAWNDGTPASNPGVVLVVTPTDPNNPANALTVTGLAKRNSVAEIYTQVIKDLLDAERQLPASNGVFATSAAASAMLSRVYLQQGRYADAAAEANKVIQTGSYSLVPRYADEFANKANTSESIFDVQLTTQSGTNDLNTFYSSNGRGDVAVLDLHLGLYNAADDRLNLFDTSNGPDAALTLKFDNIHGNIHLIRLAEMYLTRAEGNFRANTTLGATPLADVNRVRARVKLPALTTLTLPAILSERHLELAFEGFLLHDLKRNAASVGSLPYSSPKLIFPIPQRERDLNANLQQNDGY
ncbi:RagB/SusD family nutrient uptake outer membrane protein [Hymenobacter siberiensis]|uniref:RagB/SusD family nutrient uptake outer membrane protein n=1 Tax=Hymenobacter siberiensis TaxID=2848396 RepID=UPI001C1E377E|nr:RagB/SusD family nutrient uptake outer membrane protein [Hymenobacter siberiensis]